MKYHADGPQLVAGRAYQVAIRREGSGMPYDLEALFKPSQWQEGTATYDDGSTRVTGRWADECQAPGCTQVAPVVRGPGWLCLAIREPNVWLVRFDPEHGEHRSIVHDQVFWFCSPEHVASWVTTLRLVDDQEKRVGA